MTNKTGILYQIRVALGYEWEDFAEKLGYTNLYSYRNIENGKVRISPILKGRLIKMFDVNPVFLETGEGAILTTGRYRNELTQKIIASGEEQITSASISELKEMLATIAKNNIMLQEVINKQAEIIKNLEYRNGRITDQLLNEILSKAEETGEKVVISKKRSA